MAETFEAYRNRVLSYLGDADPIAVQRATPSQLDRRLRDVAPEELIRRPSPEKWSIAEIVAHLADAELAMGWRLRNMLANPGVAPPLRALLILDHSRPPALIALNFSPLAVVL